jgi:hypothetical protein
MLLKPKLIKAGYIGLFVSFKMLILPLRQAERIENTYNSNEVLE